MAGRAAAVAAMQIVAAHCVAACLPLLRKWEPVESLAYSAVTSAMKGCWQRFVQWYRSVVHHPINCLGAEPGRCPVYRFGRD